MDSFTVNAKLLSQAVKYLLPHGGRVRKINTFFSGDKLWLSTDAETIVELPCRHAANTGGFNVDAKTLIGALALYKTTDVTCARLDTNDNLTLSNGLGTQDIEVDVDYGEWFIGPRCGLGEKESACVKLTADQFNTIAKRVAIVRSNYGSASILEGLHFVANENSIEACATDGFRLVTFADNAVGWHADTGYRHGATAAINTIIPGDMVEGADLLFGKKTRERILISTISNSERMTAVVIYSEHDGVKLMRRPIPGEYPRYKELFPVDYSLEITFGDTKAVSEVAKQCCRVNKRQNLIKLSLNGQAIAKSGTDSDSGISAYSTTLKQVTYNRDIDVAFNGFYLCDALASSKQVKARGNGQLKPWVFEDDDDRVRHLLMPVQPK